jgi:hypothetical protein
MTRQQTIIIGMPSGDVVAGMQNKKTSFNFCDKSSRFPQGGKDREQLRKASYHSLATTLQRG